MIKLRHSLFLFTCVFLLFVQISHEAVTRSHICSAYDTCAKCLAAQDQYCGWCSLENKCSLVSDCQNAAEDPLHWLPYYQRDKCVIVHPPHAQKSSVAFLDIINDHVSLERGPFFCSFFVLGRTLTTNASRSASGINCATPQVHLLPSIPPGEYYLKSKLSIRTNFGPDVVVTGFEFFDCSLYQSCTTCVSNSFPCDWCIGRNTCAQNARYETCRNDVVIAGKATNTFGPPEGPHFCPSISQVSGSNNEIAIHSGLSQRIQVKINNIQSINQLLFSPISCQFNIEGGIKQVQAQLIGDVIYCEPIIFEYSSQEATSTVSFNVMWDGNKVLDNPNNIHISLFRCQNLAQSCDSCLNLPAQFECGWCQGFNPSCRIRDYCADGRSQWLERGQSCSSSIITNEIDTGRPAEGCEDCVAPPCNCIGEKGLRGSPGISGLQGLPGFPGSTGPDGPPGIIGERGEPGYPGAVGPKGIRGTDGMPGFDGTPGIPGSPGPDGPPGEQGLPGCNGTSGKSGYPGGPGRPGDVGPPGYPGDSGLKGDPGEGGFNSIGVRGEVGELLLKLFKLLHLKQIH